MTDMLKIIEEIYGKEVADILDYILKKKEVSTEELVRKFDLDPARIRKILYELETLNIIKRRRIKNGYYLHYDFKWSINSSIINKIREKLLIQHLNILKQKISELPDIVFVCPLCNVSLSFEESFEYDFKCPECGELLEQQENIEKKKLLEKIRKLEEELGVSKS